ncbi:hypothetical protein A3463_11900, partial [Enterobacter chengduensis]|uniref:hypothetical protein n=1 Tax=Enterobacter chengduensis TaxID=2494701 RepID=UPI0007B3A50F
MEFTKEQLIEHINCRKEFADECAADSTLHPERREYYELTAEALRIALASLEAEAVGYVDAEYAELLRSGHIESCSVYAEPGEGCCPVYTSPPAPVSVPKDIPDSVYDVLCQACGGGEKACDFADELWNACRAAMLQGAENAESPTTMQTAPALDSSPKIAESPSSNSPVIPDGWKLVPVELTGAMTNAMTDAILDDLHNA